MQGQDANFIFALSYFNCTYMFLSLLAISHILSKLCEFIWNSRENLLYFIKEAFKKKIKYSSLKVLVRKIYP